MSWKSVLNALRFLIDLSTHSLPSTFRRWVMPASRRFWSSILSLLLVGLLHLSPSGRGEVRSPRVSSALRQETDHRVGKGVRLFDIGNMRGVEDGEAGARDVAADQFAGRQRRCHVVTARD